MIFKLAIQNEEECYSTILDDIIIKNNYNTAAMKFNNQNRLLYLALEPQDKPMFKKSPVCLVAHIDTVNRDSFPPDCIYKEDQVYPKVNGYEPSRYIAETGKVFDDRAGIGIILSLLHDLWGKHIFPYILIMGLEELGCIGASEFANDYDELEDVFRHNNIQLLLEVDKAGQSKVCFYDLDYPDFERLFTPYFQEVGGTFSDISVLCPWFDIAGANVSAGYYLEHSANEYITETSVVESKKSIFNFIVDFQKYDGNPKYEYIGLDNIYSNYQDYYMGEVDEDFEKTISEIESSIEEELR